MKAIRGYSLHSALALAVVAIAASAPAKAGEIRDRLAERFGREPSETQREPEREEPRRPVADTGPHDSPLTWWTIPRPARSALRKLAASKDASVTRCVLSERDGQVTYEVHAARRVGPFQRQDFVLSRVSEPATTVEARREQGRLSHRIQRLIRGEQQTHFGVLNP